MGNKYRDVIPLWERLGVRVMRREGRDAAMLASGYSEDWADGVIRIECWRRRLPRADKSGLAMTPTVSLQGVNR
jgi:hypothetical protein